MSSFAGQRTRPTRGMKGSKGPQPRLRLPKMPALPEPSELEEQSSIYLKERNKQMRAKRKLAEMELAQARDRLIEKALVERQLVYMLIGMRQKLSALPEKMRVQFGPERFDHEMAQGLNVLVTEALKAVSQLPEAASPDWLETLDEKDV